VNGRTDVLETGSLQSGHDLRAVVLTPSFPFVPGAQAGSFIHDQVSALADLGLRVHVLVAQPWGAAVRQESDEVRARRKFTVEVVRYVIFPRQLFWSTAGPLLMQALEPAIRRVHARQAVDIIHAHTEALGYAAVRVGQKLGVPAIITLHGIDPTCRRTNSPRKRRQLRETLQGASRTVLVGTPLQSYFAQFADASNFVVVYNGFQLPPHTAPSQRIPRRKRHRVVSVSNLHENKGIDLTIRALALLEERGQQDVELVIVGDGTEREGLARLAADLLLSKRVYFTGALSHPEAVAEILTGDIFCLPSWREAFGIVYLEAMALGKLAIGCKGQGPADFIVDGETGLLVEPHSAEAVAQALSQVIAEPANAQRMGRAAAVHVRDNFTWRHNAERIIAVYRTALRY